MPALWSWVDPDMAEPISEVLPMGSLQNTLRNPIEGRLPAIGLVSAGDALCHTDPVFALGLSLGLVASGELARAVCDHGSDLESVALAFDAAMRPEMAERFALATETDGLRLRLWAGETFDIAHRDGGAYPLFLAAAGGAAALADGEVLRAIVRRNYFLDPLSVIDADVVLQERIERIFGDLMAIRRPRPGPTRDDLLEAMRAAVAT
ncbi:MAG: hypothetical protein ABIV26_03555 [Candidatus Limnocylindrales bacterium]